MDIPTFERVTRRVWRLGREADARIAELEAENMRVGLHNCWLEEQVEYGGALIAGKEEEITTLGVENARLLRELETICVVKNAQWGEVYAENARLREELVKIYTDRHANLVEIGYCEEEYPLNWLRERIKELEKGAGGRG